MPAFNSNQQGKDLPDAIRPTSLAAVTASLLILTCLLFAPPAAAQARRGGGGDQPTPGVYKAQVDAALVP